MYLISQEKHYEIIKIYFIYQVKHYEMLVFINFQMWSVFKQIKLTLFQIAV
jgi:hypothetical protein